MREESQVSYELLAVENGSELTGRYWGIWVIRALGQPEEM